MISPEPPDLQSEALSSGSVSMETQCIWELVRESASRIHQDIVEILRRVQESSDLNTVLKPEYCI